MDKSNHFSLAPDPDLLDPNSPESQIAEIRRYAARLPVDPSLRTLTEGLHSAAAIDAPIPEVRATTEESFQDLARDGITHVVIS